VSLLQRALGIGYGRAARLVDYMAEDGIVGQYNGSQAREVVITVEQWEAMSSGGSTGESAPAKSAPPPAPPRSGRVLTVATRSQPQVDDEEEDGEEDEYGDGSEEGADDYEEDEAPEEPPLKRRGRESA
jgi:S-DNA-T family DNA segregation ATPase FtsK/SpoIIIE